MVEEIPLQEAIGPVAYLIAVSLMFPFREVIEQHAGGCPTSDNATGTGLPLSQFWIEDGLRTDRQVA